MPRKDYYTKEQRFKTNARHRGRHVVDVLLPVDIPKYHPEYVSSPLDGDIVYCRTFGCGTILSLQERLCGYKCIKCQTSKPSYHNGKL